MSKKSAVASIATVLVISAGWTSASLAQSSFSLSGEASMNSISATITVGSAELRIKGPGVSTVKLRCGILGELVGSNPDQSLVFQHTVACDDHSLFSLSTRTVISFQAFCSGRPGIVGTFHEESTLVGLDGPFNGATGQVVIKGTLKCGFNDMEISGSLTMP